MARFHSSGRPAAVLEFCTVFDERLAHEGPPAVFLIDPEGNLRFDSEWTRDAYVRHTPARLLWCWALARDRGTGHVQLVLATAPGLLADHPRLDVRTFPDHPTAEAALQRIGRPPIAREWP
jgi:hypothetical protein